MIKTLWYLPVLFLIFNCSSKDAPAVDESQPIDTLDYTKPLIDSSQIKPPKPIDSIIVGDTTEIIDTVEIDPNADLIAKYATAGVEGGISTNLKVIDTIEVGEDINSVINSQTKQGVLILKHGTHSITNTINMKTGIVLRGESRTGTIIESTIRSTWSQGKKKTVLFNNIKNAGLENLTIFYKADVEPIDYEVWNTGGWCGDCVSNDPHGANNLYVIQVYINSGTENCWLKECRILKSGTDPIMVAGKHNSFVRNFIDQAYNKGGGGNGYYDIRGELNLFYQDTVKRLRHFAIQQGASWNVVTQCWIENDVNFHNKDNGYNLLEHNRIIVPYWMSWDLFGTGGAQYGHKPPGDNNMMLNNNGTYRWKGTKYSDKDVIYTFEGFGAPVKTDWPVPEDGKFYKN
jgi:hypothetical protein